MLGLQRGQIFRFLNQKENPDSSQGCKLRSWIVQECRRTVPTKRPGLTLSDEQIAMEVTHVVDIATAGRFFALTHHPLVERGNPLSHVLTAASFHYE
jgi:hypothetical protein